ncbi:MAG: fibronectin type III domain-containing protein [Clostridiales bacterium]|nr:fibronectin type III domain-containing protein [Clostridiales bacterium]
MTKKDYVRNALNKTVSLLLAICIAITAMSAGIGSAAAASVVHNSRFDGYTIQKGIDVSKYNGDIDWAKVKKAGIEFVFVRIGYRGYGSAGTLVADTTAKENIQGAIDAGLQVGIYMFSQATSTTEAKEEANFVLNLLSKYGFTTKDITLPIVIDFEFSGGSAGRLTKYYNSNTSGWYTNATKFILKFCSVIENAGWNAMLYANKSMLESINAGKIYSSYSVWLAHYTKETDYTGYYDYWQQTSSGSVSGISGSVDIDYRYIDTQYDLKISSRSAQSLTIKWAQVEGADGYLIYRKNSAGKWEKIAKSSGGSAVTYKDSSLSSGTMYTYRVIAYSDSGETVFAYSDSVSGITKLTANTVTASAKSYSKIKLKWTAVEGASGYQIQQYSSGEWVTVDKVSSGTTSYTVTDLTASKTYKFRVRAYKNVSGNTIYSTYQNASAKTSEPVKGTVKADKAYVRAKASQSASKLKTLSFNTQLTVIGTSGKYYKVQVTVSGKTKTGYILKSKVAVIAKTTVSAKASSTVGKMKLSWQAVSGAAGYQIQQYNSSAGEWETVKTVSGGDTLSYTVKDLNTATTYKFRVRAYKTVNGKKVYGPYSSAVKGTTADSVKGTVSAKTNVYAKAKSGAAKLASLSRNTLIKIKGSSGNYYKVSVTVNGKSKTGYVLKSKVEIIKTTTVSAKASATIGAIKLSWKAVSGAAGYQIQQYNSSAGEWETVKTVSGGDTLSYTVKDLNTATTYKFRVRAYKTVNGKKVYGPYSSAVKGTTADSVKGTVSVRAAAYENAGSSSTKLAALSRNTLVKVKGSSGKYYKVAFSENGESKTGYVLKSKVEIIAAPEAAAAADSAGEINLTWGTISGVQGYAVEQYDSSAGQWVPIAEISGASATSYTAQNLLSNKTYKFRIRAYKLVNNNNVYGPYSSTVKATAL